MVDAPESPVDRGVKDRLHALAAFLRRHGVRVDERARPAIDTRDALRVYVRLLRAATSSRLTDAEFEKNQDLARALAPDDESYLAQLLRASVGSHRDWLAANEARHRMRRAWWSSSRATTCSSAPLPTSRRFPTIRRASATSGRCPSTAAALAVTDQLFGAGYPGASYLPSTAAPCGFTPAGLPVGVQIVGPQYGDLGCLAFERLLEREFQAFVPPPGYA